MQEISTSSPLCQARHADGGARGQPVVAEVLAVHRVHCVVVPVQVVQVDVHHGHVVEGGSRQGQHLLHVLQALPGLGAGAAGNRVVVRVPALLAGDEYQVAAAGSPAVGPARRLAENLAHVSSSTVQPLRRHVAAQAGAVGGYHALVAARRPVHLADVDRAPASPATRCAGQRSPPGRRGPGRRPSVPSNSPSGAKMLSRPPTASGSARHPRETGRSGPPSSATNTVPSARTNRSVGRTTSCHWSRKAPSGANTLDAAALPVRHVDAALGVDVQAVRKVELAGAAARTAPGEAVLAARPRTRAPARCRSRR